MGIEQNNDHAPIMHKTQFVALLMLAAKILPDLVSKHLSFFIINFEQVYYEIV